HAAGIPDPDALELALPTDGSNPSIDIARVSSGPAVCTRLVEEARDGSVILPEPQALALGAARRTARARLRAVAVDRLGHRPDPMPVEALVAGPFATQAAHGRAASVAKLPIGDSRGTPLAVTARGVGAGKLRVSFGGAICQTLTVASYEERTAGKVDLWLRPGG